MRGADAASSAVASLLGDPRLVEAAASPGEKRESALTLKAALSRLPLPVVIVDAAGTLTTVNGPARRILDRKDGLSQSRQSLETSTPAETRRLRTTIRDALLMPAVPWRESRIVTVSRPSGGQPLVLIVRPLRACTPDCAPVCGRALVVIHELDWHPLECAGLIQRTFDLTPAETEVTICLMEGQSLQEIADRRGVRVSTIRSQIKSVLSKTGVSRQIDLVRLIARLPITGQE
jgi:DNA-binding CsgD family transcriptional regulator